MDKGASYGIGIKGVFGVCEGGMHIDMPYMYPYDWDTFQRGLTCGSRQSLLCQCRYWHQRSVGILHAAFSSWSEEETARARNKSTLSGIMCRDEEHHDPKQRFRPTVRDPENTMLMKLKLIFARYSEIFRFELSTIQINTMISWDLICRNLDHIYL